MTSGSVVQLLRVREVAAVLDVGQDRVRELLDTGQLAYVPFGPKSRRVHPDALAEFVARQTVAAKADRARVTPLPARPGREPVPSRQGRRGPWRVKEYPSALSP